MSALTLYTRQSNEVLSALRERGEVFCSLEFVRRKYGESAPIFLRVYRWFAAEADKRVPRPEGAESPYWAFGKPEDIGGDGTLLKLRVPAEEAVLFDLFDWNQLLQLRYLAADEADGRAFARELRDRGIRNANDVMLTAFYPDLRRRVEESWTRLFRHHEVLLIGDDSGVGGVQAALWRLRWDWVEESWPPPAL